MKADGFYTETPDIPRHRKPGKRVSDSGRRADHKHVYEDSICVYFNCFDGSILHITPSLHCSICGRYKSSYLSLRDGEQYLVPTESGRKRPMTLYELESNFPGVPIYTNGLEPNHIIPDIRIYAVEL